MPDAYKFFIHHTPNSAGKDGDRMDPYLFGPSFFRGPCSFSSLPLLLFSRTGSRATLKFRSINEFVPHLHWLLVHGPDDNIKCACKYCSKKTQTEVNQVVGLSNTTTNVSTHASSSTKRESSVGGKDKEARPAKKAKVESKLRDGSLDKVKRPSLPVASGSGTKHKNAASAHKVKSRSNEPPTYNGSYTNRQRDADLGDGALYRKGELIWVELPTPFVDLSGSSSMKITHWPALISDRTIRSESIKKASLIPGMPPSLENRQSFRYSAKLLACEDEVSRNEEQVQAWLAYPPDNGMWSGDLMLAKNSVKHVWDGTGCLRPTLAQIKGVFEAVTPFALAMQIAAHVVAAFALVYVPSFYSSSR
jgi:ribosomal protein L44E